MKNVKKLLALLLALVMLFSVCACGGWQDVEEEEGTSTSAKKNPKKDKDEEIDEDLVGAWEYEDCLMYFDLDGTGYLVDYYEEVEFEWYIDGGDLVLLSEDEQEFWEYEVDDDVLYIIDADGEEMEWIRCEEDDGWIDGDDEDVDMDIDFDEDLVGEWESEGAIMIIEEYGDGSLDMDGVEMELFWYTIDGYAYITLYLEDEEEEIVLEYERDGDELIFIDEDGWEEIWTLM